MLTVLGLSVFCVLFFGLLWRDSCRWRYLADSYAAPSAGRARDARSMQNGVLIGLGGYRSLKGILKIGLHETGASFSILAPFSLFHAPLFVPYEDMCGWKTTWYLDCASVELEFARAPDVKLVVPADQAEWIGRFARHKMEVHDVEPPDGRAGRGWHVFAVVSTAVSVGMMAALIVIVLLR